MDDDQGSQYHISHRTEQERAQAEERARQETSGLTGEELDAYLRRSTDNLDELSVQLGACAGVVVDDLQRLIHGVANVAVSLTALDPPWAQQHGNALLRAAQDSRINRGDSEGKVLLGLPTRGDEAAFFQWLGVVRSTIESGDLLGAACGYGMARLRKLIGVAGEIAIALAVIDDPRAQVAATELRRFVTKRPSAWPPLEEKAPKS